ncbi:hypothetical protein EYZ11_012060 [Aspergillus tanneri]|uniref:Transposase Tc1-like domain-containing protein n=1 Tax=Aspergillus tanneri TaxID=1220188 RepID=A0A4S3J6K3_9EURO|nr:hypothetical protein EYZ11_012060 [Aspergillus tanneri]
MTPRRPPLSPFSANIKRYQQLDPKERAYIQGLYHGGRKPTEIARLLNRPLQTIYTTLNRASLRQDFEAQPRSGRPKTYTDRDKRLVIRLIQKDPFITYADVQKTLNLTISRNTLYRIIKESGYGKWRAQKRPRLTPEVAKLRYNWAMEYKSYTDKDWAKIIWSDECSVEMGSGHRHKYVFRLNLFGKKWKTEYIQPYKKGKGVRVMVWAAIWGKKRSDLVRLERDFEAKKNGYTANSYLALLEELLPSIWEPGLIFMHDNARIHSAKKVTT